MKTQRIDIRVTEDEKQKLLSACQSETLSAFILRVALAASETTKFPPKSRSMEFCKKHPGSMKMTCGCK